MLVSWKLANFKLVICLTPNAYGSTTRSSPLSKHSVHRSTESEPVKIARHRSQGDRAACDHPLTTDSVNCFPTASSRCECFRTLSEYFRMFGKHSFRPHLRTKCSRRSLWTQGLTDFREPPLPIAVLESRHKLSGLFLSAAMPDGRRTKQNVQVLHSFHKINSVCEARQSSAKLLSHSIVSGYPIRERLGRCWWPSVSPLIYPVDTL